MCDTALGRIPPQLCPDHEKVNLGQVRKRKKCAACELPKNPGPKRDGDDSSASGPTSSLATQDSYVTIGA